MEVNYPDVGGEGYMGSMQWQLGREMGTIPAFASRTQENQENLGRAKRTWVEPREPGFVLCTISVIVLLAVNSAC